MYNLVSPLVYLQNKLKQQYLEEISRYCFCRFPGPCY
jgi:hypothetical protein